MSIKEQYKQLAKEIKVNCMKVALTIWDNAEKLDLLAEKYEDNWSVIHHGAYADYVDTATSLINSLPLADLDKLLKVHDGNGDTVLHCAIRLGCKGIVKWLGDALPQDALYTLLKIKNHDGDTAVDSAEDCGLEEVLKPLLDNLTQNQRQEILNPKNRYYSKTRLDLIRTKVHLDTDESDDSETEYSFDVPVDDGDKQSALYKIEELQDLEDSLVTEKREINGRLEEIETSLLDVRKKKQHAYQLLGRRASLDMEQQKFERPKMLFDESHCLQASIATVDTHITAPITQTLDFAVCSTSEDSSSTSEDEVQEVEDYKPVPRRLFTLINRLCKENNVKSAIITQSSEDWREVLVLASNASSIQTELEKMLKENPVLEEFRIFFDDEINPVRRKALSLTVFKSRRIDSSNNWRWGTVRSATSELLVRTQKRDAYEGSPQDRGAVYAVVPAHFILTKNQINNANRADPAWRRNFVHTPVLNNQVGPIECDHHADETDQYDRDIDSEDEYEITRLRQNFEAKTSRRMYSVETRFPKNREFVKKAEIKNPMLLCYRQNIFARQENEHMCPTRMCELGAEETCHHMFMNDIALLPLGFDDAVQFQTDLQIASQPAHGSLKKVTSVDQLWRLHEDQRIVKVGKATGKLRVTVLPEDDGERIGEQLTFVLTSASNAGETHSLDDGDCGAILYLKSKRTGKWKPLGMFVGMMERNTTRPGFTERIYQAVVLSQAFKDLESEYPHRIGPIQPFRLRYN